MGLLVHSWTFRAENSFLTEDFRVGDPADPTYLRQYGDIAAEFELYFGLGLDGVFSDNPDLAVASRDLNDVGNMAFIRRSSGASEYGTQ